MKGFVIIIITIYCLPLSGRSQNSIQFSGIILDKGGLGIPYAHLLIKSQQKGTISNAEGRFVISISEDKESFVLVVSCIGYKTSSVNFDRGNTKGLKIYLEQETSLLNEVVVRPSDNRELIREAIRKIPINYPASPSSLSGFYRESLRYDSTRYVYISEGVLQAKKESYKEPQRSGQVKLLKARKKEFPDSLKTLEKIRFYAGPHIVHRFDFVIQRLEFINEDKLKNYTYSIDAITSSDGNQVYKISFKPINGNGLFEGTLWLDVNTSAFISAKYKLTEKGLSNEKNSIFNRYLRREYMVNYRKANNKWAIQNIWQQGELRSARLKNNLFYATEFVATEIDTTNLPNFNYGERLQFADVFVDKANNLDPEFWDGYNIIKENSFIEQLQDKELNQKSTTLDYSIPTNQSPDAKIPEVKIRKPRTRLAYDLDLVVILPNYNQSNVELLGNEINILKKTNLKPAAVFGLGYNVGVPIGRGVSIVLGASSSTVFQELHFSNVNLGGQYSFNTTVKTRPLRWIAGLSVSYTDLYLPLDVIKGPLDVKGKTLTGSIDVNLEREYFALQPSIKASLELSRRWDVFAKANLLLDFDTKNKIFFKEKSGNGNATIPTSDPSLNFKVNGERTETVPISISSMFMSVGFSFKFQR
jgi:hypothetical protein